MKRVKNKFSMVVVLLVLFIIDSSLSFSIDVFTPNGSPVPDISCPTAWTLEERELRKGFLELQFDEFFDEDSTEHWAEELALCDNQYNCHAYALGGVGPDSIIKFRIGWDPETGQYAEDIYWDDYSYQEVTDPDSATIASHPNWANHTVVLTGDWYNSKRVVISKWGLEGLYRHYLLDDLFSLGQTIDDLKFYRLWPDPWVITENTTISDSRTIRGSVIVNSGVTLTIASGDSIRLHPGKNIDINGTLVLNEGSAITKVYGEDGWGSININSGGELWINGSATIDGSDDFAINIYTGGVLDIDAPLTIHDCLEGGIYLDGGDYQNNDEEVVHIECCDIGVYVYETTDVVDYVEIEYCTYGFVVVGSSTTTLLYYNTVIDQEYEGVYVTPNANAILKWSIINTSRDEWGCNTGVDDGGFLNMSSGNNDLDPGEDNLAIGMHPDAENVLATQNYWGSSYPTWEEFSAILKK